MTEYALLIAPSSNRVYAAAAYDLTRAELAIFGAAVLSQPLRDMAIRALGGVDYVVWRTDTPLTAHDVECLSDLSSGYALFEIAGDLLRPLPVAPLARFDDDLITIPKYAGKTNEQFTQLLVNVTVLASAAAPAMRERRITVLDPMCGRGTTLNQALMYGYDAIGIELDGKDLDAYSAFLRTWLQRKRLKHHTELNPVRRDRRLLARRFSARIGDSRAAQQLTMFHADTLAARDFLPAGCADVIAVDLPYGVAHGSKSASGLSRRPMELLVRAVPVWRELLRPGGALGLSWNTFVAGRPAVAQVLSDNGFVVRDDGGYQQLAHRVDQAIHRDILVAVKPR